ADVYVKLVNASSAGKIKGRSELMLDIQSVIFQGRTYNVSTSDVKQAGASRGKRSAATIGGGAVLGALIGGLAGGGKRAAIGAGVAAGAGTFFYFGNPACHDLQFLDTTVPRDSSSPDMNDQPTAPPTRLSRRRLLQSTAVVAAIAPISRLDLENQSDSLPSPFDGLKPLG